MNIDTNKLPNLTKKIFDTLRNGNFIVDNHPETEQRKMFAICENYYSVLSSYFEPLGYDLERGDGYFLFYTQGMLESTKEHRMTQLLHILDLIDLLLGVFPNLSVGWKASPSDLEMNLKGDTLRREHLEKMRGIRGKTLLERCNSVFDAMNKFGCLVPLEDKYNNYLLTSSYNYVIEFFEAVQRIDSEKDEVEL